MKRQHQIPLVYSPFYQLIGNPKFRSVVSDPHFAIQDLEVEHGPVEATVIHPTIPHKLIMIVIRVDDRKVHNFVSLRPIANTVFVDDRSDNISVVI
jgi:hypothetical protein